jgi:dUTP pyrophosphatase
MNKSLLEEAFGRRPRITFEKTHPNAILPSKTYQQDVGWDLYAVEDVTIPAKSQNVVDIGLKLAYLDQGYWFKVESRSGLAFNHNITAFAGIIDNTYRGVIGVKLFNFGTLDYHVKAGDRIAQMVIYMENIDFDVQWGKVVETNRGNAGFGSTGI